MGSRSKKALSLLVSAALAASLGALPGTAFAAGGLGGAVGSDTSWTVPTGQMKNYVSLNTGDNGSPEPYKVITTWANAWALSGPDYLGVANSGPLNQQGGGAGSTTLANAQSQTLLGIWASSANEVPNAYNWNYFYNLALTERGADLVDTAAVDVQNGSSPGFDSESGVWVPFKYRPEIVWTSNSLNAGTASKMSALIKEGKYWSGAGEQPAVTKEGEGNNAITSASAEQVDGTWAADTTGKKLYNDESYEPFIMSAINKSPLTFTDSFYELADYANQVIANTQGYTNKDGDGKALVTYNADGSVNSDSNLTWRNMNYLPRTTRYLASAEHPMSATESALAVEKVTRGSVYYTLSQIASGKTTKKKVAFLTKDPETDGSTAEVVAYSFVDQIGGGPTGGKSGVAPLVVDQLTSADVVQETPAAADSGVGYTTYTVNANDLAGCDYVVDANGSLNTAALKDWVVANATGDSKTRATNTVQYLTQCPAILNGHNFTTEKMIWGAFNLDFFYPELFPNMELTTWWYDNIYHLNSANVKQAMQWGLANASLPAETDLSSLTQGYTAADCEAKFLAGYNYYQSSMKNAAPYNTDQYKTLAPSATYGDWVTAQTAGAITVSATKSYSKTTNSAAFTLKPKASVSGASFSFANDNTGVVSVSKTGKVTIKGKGTAHITITGSKDFYQSGSTTVTVKVTAAKAQPMTAKGNTVSVKAGNTVTAKKAYTVKKNQGKLTYTKKSGNKKIKVNASNGKITVPKGLSAKTYKVGVRIKAAGNEKYKSGTKDVTVTLKVTK